MSDFETHPVGTGAELIRLRKAVKEALGAYRQPHGLGDAGRLSAIVSILQEVEIDGT